MCLTILHCRHFEELDLGKMKTVYPDAYTFRQETNVPGEYSAGRHYHLIITINSEDPQLSAVSLVRRRQIFRDNLLAIVKKHHRDFLSSLDPPLEIPDHKVLRWHAGFSTDSVPAVEAAPLPAPPFGTYVYVIGLAINTVEVSLLHVATFMPLRREV